MRKVFLPLAAALCIAMTPQLASAAPSASLAGVQAGTSLVEQATYYRRDYGYFPRHPYYRYFPPHPFYPHYLFGPFPPHFFFLPYPFPPPPLFSPSYFD